MRSSIRRHRAGRSASTRRPSRRAAPPAPAATSPNLSGFPDLIVPAGFSTEDLPIGISFLGPAFSESRLLAIGYAFEQATKARRLPVHTPLRPGDTIAVPYMGSDAVLGQTTGVRAGHEIDRAPRAVSGRSPRRISRPARDPPVRRRAIEPDLFPAHRRARLRAAQETARASSCRRRMPSIASIA